MSKNNPFTLPEKEELHTYTDVVTTGTTPFLEGVKQTAKDTRKAVGGLVSDTLSIPLKATEAAINVPSYILGASSGAGYLVSNGLSRTRGKIRRTITGQDLEGSTKTLNA